MSDLEVTVDNSGWVQSATPVEAPLLKRCPACNLPLARSAFEPDMRTKDRLSATCKSCRKKGYYSLFDVKNGKPNATIGQNLPQNRKAEEKKVVSGETSEQRIMAAVSLVLESLDAEERKRFTAVMAALGG